MVKLVAPLVTLALTLGLALPVSADPRVPKVPKHGGSLSPEPGSGHKSGGFIPLGQQAHENCVEGWERPESQRPADARRLFSGIDRVAFQCRWKRGGSAPDAYNCPNGDTSVPENCYNFWTENAYGNPKDPKTRAEYIQSAWPNAAAFRAFIEKNQAHCRMFKPIWHCAVEDVTDKSIIDNTPDISPTEFNQWITYHVSPRRWENGASSSGLHAASGDPRAWCKNPVRVRFTSSGAVIPPRGLDARTFGYAYYQPGYIGCPDGHRLPVCKAGELLAPVTQPTSPRGLCGTGTSSA